MNLRCLAILCATIVILTMFLSFFAADVQAQVTISKVPPTNASTMKVGDVLILTFEATYSGSTDSRAIVSVGFNSSGWTYAGFEARIETTDVTDGFSETISPGKVDLKNNDLQPDEGTLKLNLNFKAIAEGNYAFNWASAFSILAGAHPDIEAPIGTTSVMVSPYVSRVPTSISLSFTPSKIDISQGQTVTIVATLSPPLSGKAISLYYGIDDSWNLIAAGETDDTGNYVYTWYPSPTPGEGTYYLKAEFSGDNNYTGCASSTHPVSLVVIPEFPAATTLLAIALVVISAYAKRIRK